jgi:hypothetical protein
VCCHPPIDFSPQWQGVGGFFLVGNRAITAKQTLINDNNSTKSDNKTRCKHVSLPYAPSVLGGCRTGHFPFSSSLKFSVNTKTRSWPLVADPGIHLPPLLAVCSAIKDGSRSNELASQSSSRRHRVPEQHLFLSLFPATVGCTAGASRLVSKMERKEQPPNSVNRPRPAVEETTLRKLFNPPTAKQLPNVFSGHFQASFHTRAQQQEQQQQRQPLR